MKITLGNCFQIAFAIVFLLSGPLATAQSFPSVNPVGTGQNNAPVTAYQAPDNIPANEMPVPEGVAVGVVAAVQSYAVSQQNPTSPTPNCSEPPASTSYNFNQYYWPTLAQSIAWWEAQPGIPATGTFAYLVGTEYSHQDAEGWAGSCAAVPEPPCSTAAGWTGYTWGGQFTGWTGSCFFTPEPTCPGIGNVAEFSWTGSVWSGSCVYVAPPLCPIGYTNTYVWNPTSQSYSGGCSQPPQPSCPVGPGYSGGSYVWNPSSGVWVDECGYTPQPSCPGGYNGAYVWNGSAWVDQCSPSVIPTVFNIILSGPNGHIAISGCGCYEATFSEFIALNSGSCTPGVSYNATSVNVDGFSSSQWNLEKVANGWRALANYLQGKTLVCYGAGFGSAQEQSPNNQQPTIPIGTSAGTVKPNSVLLSQTNSWSGL